MKVIDIKLKIFILETGQRQDDNIDLLLFQFSKHGSLENTGYLNGYPIGVLIWVAVKINAQTGFRFILLSRRCQLGLPN